MNPIKFCWHILRDSLGFPILFALCWFLTVVAVQVMQ